jgi:hypothetical protein
MFGLELGGSASEVKVKAIDLRHWWKFPTGFSAYNDPSHSPSHMSHVMLTAPVTIGILLYMLEVG